MRARYFVVIKLNTVYEVIWSDSITDIEVKNVHCDRHTLQNTRIKQHIDYSVGGSNITISCCNDVIAVSYINILALYIQSYQSVTSVVHQAVTSLDHLHKKLTEDDFKNSLIKDLSFSE